MRSSLRLCAAIINITMHASKTAHVMHVWRGGRAGAAVRLRIDFVAADVLPTRAAAAAAAAVARKILRDDGTIESKLKGAATLYIARI